MPSERDIDNYINEFEEKNQIYMEEELEYAEKCHNLEEQLGCLLEVVFKALKQMFVFHKENVKIELLGLHIKSNELYLYGFVEGTSRAVYLSLKDHKKTWWLKKNRSE